VVFFERYLSSTLSKIKNSVFFIRQNPGFLANTFSTSQIIDEAKKLKLLSHKGFRLSDRVAKKMDKVELRGCLKSVELSLKCDSEVQCQIPKL
jgi:hypothetical protein